MQEHLTPQQIADFAARRLAPRTLPVAARHLAGCATCQSRLSALAGASARVNALRSQLDAEVSHLSEETLAGLVQHTLNQTELAHAQTHLDVCEECATQAWELQALLPFHLSPIPVVQPHHPGWWERICFTWSQWQASWQLSPLLLTTGLIAVIALSFTLAGWRHWHTNPVPLSEVSLVPTQTAQPSVAFPALAQPAASPALIASLRDGSRVVSLDEQNQLQGLPALSPADEQMVKTALREQRLVIPAALADLHGRASALLGESSGQITFALRAPLGIVTRTARPTFRWEPLAGAASYTVAILDTDFHVVATSVQLNVTNWTPAQPLPRNRTYLWQVTAQVGDQSITAPAAPAPEARFRVLDAQQAFALQRAEKDHADSQLILGLRYAQSGLLAEAERAFKTLRAGNPQSPLADKLLQQAQAMRR